MFKKLRLKLTLLAGAISTLILCVMSLCLLYVSESSQWQNSYLSFQSDMTSILTGFEQQKTISHSWLKKTEKGKYKIYLEDNGSPYLFNSLSLSEQEKLLAGTVLTGYRNSGKEQESVSVYKSYHQEYPWSDVKMKEVPLSRATHFAGCMSINKNNSLFHVVVLASQEQLRRRFMIQRLLFLLFDLAGALFFFLFARIFTGRLLIPLEENQKRQTDFLSSVSHELRTPLSVILASVSACEIAPPEEQKRFLTNVKRECKRMQGLITDMLLSVNGRSHLPLNKEAVDAQTLLLNVYEAFEPLAKEKKLSLVIKLPDETLPDCACDPEKISQLLSVFIHNAMCYTPEGGRITLSLAKKARAILFSVADTGPGIPDADKKHIFERFYRVETSHSQKEHFGLGLSIAKEIAVSHKGSITVADNEPKGSIFTLKLPV